MYLISYVESRKVFYTLELNTDTIDGDSISGTSKRKNGGKSLVLRHHGSIILIVRTAITFEYC